MIRSRKEQRLTLCVGLAIITNWFVTPALCQADSSAGPRPGPVNFSESPTCKAEAISQLHRLIEADYAYWTGSKENSLTISHIGELARNSSLTGGQAILIGILALTMDHAHGFVDRFSFDQVMSLARGDTIEVKTSPRLARNAPNLDEPDTFKFRNVVINYHNYFDNLVSNKATGSYKLWGRESGPILDGVRQAAVGDCYWISAVEAVVEKRPEKIAQSIRQVGPDRFELALAGSDKPFQLTITDAEMAQLNLEPHQGCWLTVLGLAEAQTRNRAPDIVPFWKETPLGVVAHGGSQLQVLESLMGVKYDSVRPSKIGRRRAAAILERAMQEKMPVGLTTPGHCLSVCNYNPQSRVLTVRNPWGTSDKYRIEGTPFTVQMDHGIFDISLNDACRSFRTISLPLSVVRSIE